MAGRGSEPVSGRANLPRASLVGMRVISNNDDEQVERYGKYKSAGGQLLRRDMSEAQREASTALLDDIYNFWSEQVAPSSLQARGTTHEL